MLINSSSITFFNIKNFKLLKVRLQPSLLPKYQQRTHLQQSLHENLYLKLKLISI